MAGTLSIRSNGEEVASVNFDSLEGVTVQGMNIASYYRSPDPENDMSSIDILGENVVAGPARKGLEDPFSVESRAKATEVPTEEVSPKASKSSSHQEPSNR